MLMRPLQFMPNDREPQTPSAARAESQVGTSSDQDVIGVYSCDASGVIQYYNNRAAELWGRRPTIGDTDERFCGSFMLYRADGRFMPHEQCPMADVLNGKVSGVYNAEVHIKRENGTRVIVVVNIAPMIDDDGDIVGAVNSFYEVTDRAPTKA